MINQSYLIDKGFEDGRRPMSWTTDAVIEGRLCDRRLQRRLGQVLERLSARPTESIPAACRGWAETQAAYRFLSNERVGAVDILDGHSRATLQRNEREPVVWIVQDTTFLE
jgi:hypothetical protein